MQRRHMHKVGHCDIGTVLAVAVGTHIHATATVVTRSTGAVNRTRISRVAAKWQVVPKLAATGA
eukprot:COSAG06_NODE_2659_length_6481_cov_7.712943_4_plen_64_part_00